jgi:division protein CdvB (Snf7/Vps24/ESCRT-III family)
MFRERKSLRERVREAVSPKPMSEKLWEVTHRLRLQLSRLERTAMELESRDRSLYDKCVEAMKRSDVSRAKMYAEECVQIRKIAKVSLNSQFALEKVALRLEGVKSFGDMAYDMMPLKKVVGTIRTELANVMPNISLQLAGVDESLSSMVLDIGEATGTSTIDQPTGDAKKILEEAAVLAEQQFKEKFPELPTTPAEGTQLRPF